MRLIPKAKAVRIRIKSGGEEHSSLDSLKRNFDLSDVRVLLDGRLSRWLKQQGEHDLASKIESSDKQKLIKEDFSLCKLFFGTEINNKISNIHSFADYCVADKRYEKTGNNIFKKLIYQDKNIAKVIYKNSQLDSFTDINWISVFSKYEDTGDPEILFFLGKLWYKSKGENEDVSKGKSLMYIIMAVNEYLQVVIEYINKIKYEKVNKKRIRKWIQDNWDSKYKSDFLVFEGCFNLNENNLIRFVCSSYKIAYSVFHNTHSKISILSTFDNCFIGLGYIPEIVLIKAILLKDSNQNNYMEELKKIKDKCKLAKIEFSFVNHSFKKITTTPKKIEYIVKHFLDD